MKKPALFSSLFSVMICGLLFSIRGEMLIHADFEDLTPGALVGQGGGSGLDGSWSVTGSSAPSVIGSGLIYTASDGGTIDGGSRSLSSTGSGDFINRSINGGVNLAQTVFVRYLLQGQNSSITDQQIFTRYNGWDTYSALKFNSNTHENRIGSGDNTGVAAGPLNQFVTYLVVDRLTYSGGSWVQIDSWINPLRGDLGTPAATHSDGTMNPSMFSMLDIRLQNRETVIDEYLVATTWEEVVPAEAIPEASSVLLLGVGAVYLLRMHRKRLQLQAFS